MKQLIAELKTYDPKLPHCSNIRTKALKDAKEKGKNSAIIEELINLYLQYYRKLETISTVDSKTWVVEALQAYEVYASAIKDPKYKLFSHQSDFLSSLLPEFLYILYTKFVVSKYSDLKVETQRDLVIDLSFLPYESAISFKSKRVDVAILKQCSFSVNGKILPKFNIPLVAVEVKTNLDKNMISGVEYSVQRLKRTFPICKYYLIAELVDFAYQKQNYASSSIDEILIKRKQKRSETRNGKKILNPMDVELMQHHLEEVLQFLTTVETQPAVLSHRLKTGKLITR